MKSKWSYIFIILVVVGAFLILKWNGGWDVVYPSIKEALAGVWDTIQNTFGSLRQ